MFLFSISVQSQAVLNSGIRSSVVKAGMRGPGGGVGPAENVAQDGVAQAEANDDDFHILHLFYLKTHLFKILIKIKS